MNFIIIFLFFLNSIFSFNNSVSEIKNNNLHNSINCGIKHLTLETKRIKKKRRFLFWKLNYNKIIVIDKVFDSNKNKILETKSIYICSMDACDTRKNSRIRIMKSEIWIFKHGKDYNSRYIDRYNHCGQFIGKKDWEKHDFYIE